MEPQDVDVFYVERCMVFSVSTLLAMPPDRISTRLAQGRHDILREAIEGYGWHGLRNRPAAPASQAISDMDEIASWLRFIRQTPIRRIVALRAAVHPISNRPISFDRIGKRLVPSDPVDGKSVQRWHNQGLAAIVAQLRAGAARRLPDLPEPEIAEILDERLY